MSERPAEPVVQGDGAQQAARNEQNTPGDGERPRVQVYTSNKFRPNDRVYLSTGGGRGLQGPYLVSSVPSPRQYVLCTENGVKIEGGRSFAESDLSWA